MKKMFQKILCILWFTAVASLSFGLTAYQQGYIDQIALGGSGNVRTASQNIYKTNEKSVVILDVLAEKLLRDMTVAGGFTNIDA